MNVGSLSIDLTLDGQNFTVQVKNAGQLLRELKNDFSKTGDAVDAIGRKFNGFGGNLIYAVHQIQAVRYAMIDFRDIFLTLPTTILKTSGEIERLTKVMEGLSTAQDKVADAKLSQKFLFDFAQRAPFEITALKDVFIKLKTGGVDPMNGSMQTLVDSVAKFGGNSEVLKRAALAVQQMGGKGVVSMEELRRQLGEAIPDAMQMMALGTGKSMAQLNKDVQKGTVESTSAMERMFIAMNIFNRGAAAEMMDTWTGMMERLKTKWQLFQYGVAGSDTGAGLFGVAKEELGKIINLLDEEQFRKFGNDLADMFYTGAKALSELVQGVVKYYEEIKVAGELMLYYFAGTKLTAAFSAVKSGITHIGSTYAKSAADYVAAEQSKVAVAQITSASRIKTIETEIAAEMKRAALRTQMAGKEFATLRELQLAYEKAALTPGWSSKKMALLEAEIAKRKELITELQVEAVAIRNVAQARTAEIAAIEASTVAITANANATGALAATKRAAAGAMGLARGAMTMLGGPIGLITTALLAGIWAWEKWGDAAGKAAEAARHAASKMSTAEDLVTTERQINDELANRDRWQKMVDNGHSSAQKMVDESNAKLEALYKLKAQHQANIQENYVKDVVDLAKVNAEREVKALTSVEKEKLDRMKSAMTVMNHAVTDPGNTAGVTVDVNGETQVLKYIADAASREAKMKELREAFTESIKGTGSERELKIAGYYKERLKEVETQIAGVGKETKEYAALNALKVEYNAEIDRALEEEKKIRTKLGTPNIDAKGGGGQGGRSNESPIKKLLINAKSELEALKSSLEDSAEGIDDASKIYDATLAKFMTKWHEGGFKYGKNKEKDATLEEVVGLSVDEAETEILKKAQSLINKLKELEVSGGAAAKDAWEKLLNPGAEVTKENQIDKTIATLQTKYAPALAALDVELKKTGKSLEGFFANLRSAPLLTDAVNLIGKMVEQTKKLAESLERDPVKRENARYAEEYKKQSDAYEQMRQKMVNDTNVTFDQIMALEDAWVAYEFQLWRQHVENLKTPLQKLADEWADTTKQMDAATKSWAEKTMDAIFTVTKGGEVDWRNMLKSMVEDVGRIALNKALGDIVTTAFDGIGNVLKGVFGIKGGLGKSDDRGTMSNPMIVQDIKDSEDAVRKLLDQNSNGAQETSLLDTVASKARTMFDDVKTGLSSVWDKLGAGLSQFTDSLSGVFNSFSSALSGSSSGGSSSGSGSWLGTAVSLVAGYFTGGSSGGDGMGGYSYVGTDTTGGYVDAGFANGGIMTEFGPASLRKYANGGIAHSPQVALFGEGSMNEAFVPLPDGRSIPVSFYGSPSGFGGNGGSASNVVSISITVNSDGTSNSSENGTNSGDWQKLAGRIKSLVQEEIVNQKRPGGTLNS